MPTEPTPATEFQLTRGERAAVAAQIRAVARLHAHETHPMVRGLELNVDHHPQHTTAEKHPKPAQGRGPPGALTHTPTLKP
jgi:hypothetical protein